MTLEETRKKILEDDEFVLSEIEKLRYAYKLKKEIRYAQKREGSIDTESVAEHIYGMYVITSYFLPLEDVKSEWDKQKILETIVWHDADELVTGDTITHWKTEEFIKQAETAVGEAISNLPELLQKPISKLVEEYEARQSIEAQFVKAIDKIEPLFEVWEDFYKDIMHRNGNTLELHWKYKRPYIEKFPYLMRFAEVATNRLQQKGFFAVESDSIES